MTPRKASLRVAHAGSCKNASRTALDSLKGCTCEPSYYASWQDVSGKTCKSPRVRDRRVADKVLRERQVKIDQGHVEYRQVRDITLPDWIDEYAAILEQRDIKGGTRRSYAHTLKLAQEALGWVSLRSIGNPELRKFYATMEHTAPATRIRRLKGLSISLNVAKDEGYIDVNPVPAFSRSLRLRSPKTGSPPFTDAEIAKLWVQLAKPKVPKVYAAICKAAVVTGARQGELIALEWDALDLTNGALQIRSTYNSIDGVIAPKSRDARTVYLDAAGLEFFAEWIAEVGAHKEGLVFRAPRGGYLNNDYSRRVVHAALTAAGIALVDADNGLKRKPFHSLRATYTRRMLEQGHHPSWVERNLGHSDLRLTMHVYGAWTKDAMRAEASRDGQAA